MFKEIQEQRICITYLHEYFYTFMVNVFVRLFFFMEKTSDETFIRDCNEKTGKRLPQMKMLLI